ncbi:hypothetical protein [Demequina sp.]|uniref:hypothetical protein n=1 Tax=Demequina sp. TaxID=2050685 RepID=UPI003D0D5611
MRVHVAAATFVVLVLAGCTDSSAPRTTIGEPVDPFDGESVAYCESQGGEVQERQPMYGTNTDESDWIPFGQPIRTCKLSTLGDETAIFIDLHTMYSQNPTLAALAYSQASLPEDLSPSGNPAAAICSELGGTSSFGPGANGGGLVDLSDDDFPVFAPCMFADGSFIEEWGIAYHLDGSVRGADLAPRFRFDTQTAPHVYG